MLPGPQKYSLQMSLPAKLVWDELQRRAETFALVIVE